MSTTLVSKDPLARLAEQQALITEDSERSLQALIKQVVHSAGGDKLRRALHGDWLHEPLHVILTDVPVGSWTATVAFDALAAVSGESKFASSMNAAADATLILGLVGAVGAAVTGMNDWSEIERPAPRKIGLVHAALNIVATSLFIGSAIFRSRKSEEQPGEASQDRNISRVLGFAGYLLVSAGAHLGGTLIYEHGIGVQASSEAATVTDSMKG